MYIPQRVVPSRRQHGGCGGGGGGSDGRLAAVAERAGGGRRTTCGGWSGLTLWGGGVWVRGLEFRGSGCFRVLGCGVEALGFEAWAATDGMRTRGTDQDSDRARSGQEPSDCKMHPEP